MNIDELKELVSDLDEAICRLNIKISNCAENGIEGYINIKHGSVATTGFYISKNSSFELDSANLKINLLDK